MFNDGLKFPYQLLRKVTQGTFLFNYFKIWQAVSEKRIFLRISSIVPIVQEAPIHQSHVYGWIKISQTTFEKGHQGTFLWNYFKIWPAVWEKIFSKFLHVHIVQEVPIHQSHFYGRIKILQTFLKRVTKGTFLWNYFKIGPAVQEEKILKELLKKFCFFTMATTVFDGIKVCEQFLKRTSQGPFLPSLVQIGLVVWEEKIFKEIVDDGRQTPGDPKSSPWACHAQVS